MSTQSSGGIGIVGALGVVFVTLKLTNQIDWPWWQVLIPFWAPPAALLVVLAIGGAMIGLGRLLETAEEKKNRKAAEALRDFSKALENRRR